VGKHEPNPAEVRIKHTQCDTRETVPIHAPLQSIYTYDCGMKHLVTILTALALLPAAAHAQDEANQQAAASWNRLAALDRGQEIVVKAAPGRTARCLFSGAIDTALFCEPYFQRPDGAEYRFDRAQVEQVRLNQMRRNMHIVIWSVTAAGFIWGVSDPRLSTNGTPRFVTGLAGAGAGAMAGLVISLPAALLIPGKLIYRRPALFHRSAPSPAPLQ
jgi:hypothetical protein